jgi:hypothetical protein
LAPTGPQPQRTSFAEYEPVGVGASGAALGADSVGAGDAFSPAEALAPAARDAPPERHAEAAQANATTRDGSDGRIARGYQNAEGQAPSSGPGVVLPCAAMRKPGVVRTCVRGAAFGVAISACSPTFGRFTQTAYRSEEYPLAVHYAGGSPATILGKDWIVDNFRYVDGAPESEKSGPRYIVTRDYDTDADGRPETSADEPLWALKLEHRKEDAVIWLSTLPLSEKDRDKDLSVLAHRWLDDMSGSESVATVDSAAPAMVALSERRSAVRSLDASACSVSGREAFSVDADVANVDALSVSPSSRSRRMRLVIIRSGYSHHPDHSKGSSDFPVFVIAGYSNAPEAFATRLADFNEFLSLLALGGDHGSQGAVPHTCTARAPALETESAPPQGVPSAPEPPSSPTTPAEAS